MTACLAAGATGARTFTASASAGLALMHEMLFVTSGSRVPVVMAVANRALSAPLNIHGDHSDSMAERDSGWLQIYVENAQEAYDSIIQAFKIAEDIGVSLPIIVGLDGFTISHTLERVDTLSDNEVKQFVGERQFPFVLTHEGKTVPFKLDPETPMTLHRLAVAHGAVVGQDDHVRLPHEGQDRVGEFLAPGDGVLGDWHVAQEDLDLGQHALRDRLAGDAEGRGVGRMAVYDRLDVPTAPS